MLKRGDGFEVVLRRKLRYAFPLATEMTDCVRDNNERNALICTYRVAERRFEKMIDDEKQCWSSYQPILHYPDYLHQKGQDCI